MASFVFPDASAAGSGMGGLLFLRIRDVSVEDNFVDLGLHEEVWVPTEDLSSLICKTLFNVDYNDVDAIGTNLDVEGTNPLVYPIASLSSPPSLFKDIPNISSIEWVPLFFSETSGRYFYFGNKREIIFIDLEKPTLPVEGRGRPMTAASSDQARGAQRFRPTRTEGKGRPMTAASSDKSHGHRRLRPTRQEGAGRPLSASPGDRRTWDSAYQPSPTGVQSIRPLKSVVDKNSQFWYPIGNDGSAAQNTDVAAYATINLFNDDRSQGVSPSTISNGGARAGAEKAPGTGQSPCVIEIDGNPVAWGNVQDNGFDMYHVDDGGEHESDSEPLSSSSSSSSSSTDRRAERFEEELYARLYPEAGSAAPGNAWESDGVSYESEDMDDGSSFWDNVGTSTEALATSEDLEQNSQRGAAIGFNADGEEGTKGIKVMRNNFLDESQENGGRQQGEPVSSDPEEEEFDLDARIGWSLPSDLGNTSDGSDVSDGWVKVQNPAGEDTGEGDDVVANGGELRAREDNNGEQNGIEVFEDAEDGSLFYGMQPESWKSALPMQQRVRGLGPL